MHGLGEFSEIWLDNIPHLIQDGYRVVAYDLYGNGLSRPVKNKIGLFDLTNQLNDVINELKLDNLHLISVGQAAAIALDYAKLNSTKIQSLTLISPFGITTS